jgi:cytosine permease
MIADYFIVHPRLNESQLNFNKKEAFNWSGILVCAAGFILAHYVLNSIIKIEFFTALIFSVIAYPPLRLMSLSKYK